MRIMLINHYAGSDYNGMEFRPFYMAREWIKLGHEVVIVAADYTHLRRKNPIIERDFDEQDIDGVKFVFIKTPEYHGNNLGRAKNIAAFCFKLSHNANMMAHKYKPEAVIASSTYPLDIYSAAKIAKKAGARLYFEIHDLWPLTPMEMGNLPWWNPMIMLLQAGENYAFKRSEKIISILPNTDKYIKLRGFDVSKFVYVPNGIFPDGGVARPSDEPQVAQLKSLRKEGFFIVAYTGNHSSANALELFIAAAAFMRDEKVKFVLAGSGNVKAELIVQAKGTENVLFLDSVKKDSMGALLEQIDVAYMGLAKSRLFDYGISPNKLFDYMLASKPIIYAVEASNNPVRDSNCGVTVPVGEPKKTAAAVRILMALDKAELAKIGANGRDYVIKNHEYATLAKRFVDNLKGSIDDGN